MSCVAETAKNILQTKYSKPDGSPLLHIVEECPRHYYLTYIMKRGSPFISQLNMVLMQYYEAGKVMEYLR